MFGVLRRKASSASAIASSLRSTRSQVCTPEIACNSRAMSHVRNFCHLKVPGQSGNLRLSREGLTCFQSRMPVQMWTRPFCSSDLVDAVVPFMGESISDGTLATFLKKPGDRVEIDEPIAQIETDKVTIDVTSPEAGVIQEFVANEGDTVEPGTRVAVISKSGEGAVSHVAPSEEQSETAAPQPSPPVEDKKEEPKPQVEKPPVAERPKEAPSKRSATEPILPP